MQSIAFDRFISFRFVPLGLGLGGSLGGCSGGANWSGRCERVVLCWRKFSLVKMFCLGAERAAEAEAEAGAAAAERTASLASLLASHWMLALARVRLGVGPS